MDYSWDIDKIKEDKKLYNALLKSEDSFSNDSEKDKKNYEKILANIKALDRFFFLREISLETSLNTEFFIDIYNNVKENRNKEYVSFSDSLTLTYDFYIEVLKSNNTLKKTFLEEFNRKNDHINVVDNDPCSQAYTIHSALYKTSYICICPHNNIDDVIALIHEYGHVIAKKNSNKIYFYNTLSEFESMFMEMLSYEYFKNNNILMEDFLYKKNVALVAYQNKMRILDTFYQISYLLYTKMDGIFKEKKLEKIITENFDISKKELNKFCNFNLNENLPYLAAQAYAFDFVNLYRRFPKYAINVYEQMIKLSASGGNNTEKLNRELKKMGLNPSSSYKRF